jgi:hypothetical protein
LSGNLATLAIKCTIMTMLGAVATYPAGDFAGSRGSSLELQGFALQLVGINAERYWIEYRAKIETDGWLAIQRGGTYTGTTTKDKRLIGFDIWIVGRCHSSLLFSLLNIMDLFCLQ